MKIYILVLLSTALFSFHTEAAVISAIPDKWKLENYIGGKVVIWYSETSCQTGKLSLPTHSTSEDHNRLWSLILAAKTASSKVTIHYNENAGNCEIVSFGLSPE